MVNRFGILCYPFSYGSLKYRKDWVRRGGAVPLLFRNWACLLVIEARRAHLAANPLEFPPGTDDQYGHNLPLIAKVDNKQC